MAYTEENHYNAELTDPWKFIRVRKAVVTKKDGKEVGRQYHRHVKYPGDKVSQSDLTAAGQAELYCPDAEKIANAVWTTDVINAWTVEQKRQDDARKAAESD